MAIIGLLLPRWFRVERNNSVGIDGTEEDDKLHDAVEKRKGEDWVSISELVPDRTKQQCRNRWQFVLDSKSDETTPRVGKWTTDEDITLKNAVEKHNG
jgi:hypothetical protein